MGEYFIDDFNLFDSYGVETEAVDALDVISYYFMHQWIAIMSEEEKKPPDENSSEPRSPDAILYEPIADKKKKAPDPEPDPEPRAEDFYCED